MKINRIIGLLKLLFYKIQYFKKFTFKLKSNCSLSLVLRISQNGTIVMESGVEIRGNTILNVSGNGTIFLGEKVFINDGCKINCHEDISIGKGTIIGQNVLIYDHDHDYNSGAEKKRNTFVNDKISIGENVWIGSGVIILKGVTIGDNAVIGAGTVVKKNVERNHLIYNKSNIVEREINYE